MPPPIDFAQRRLPVVTQPADTLLRIHKTVFEPIWYGKGGDCRLDDPKREYGVLYAADTLTVAIAETIIRAAAAKPTPSGVIVIPERDIRIRSVTTLKSDAPMSLANLTGTSLFGLGGSASELQSDDYMDSQPWSAAVYYRPEMVDGILYQSRYINTNPAVAVFDRGGERVNLDHISTMPLEDYPDLDAILTEINAVVI